MSTDLIYCGIQLLLFSCDTLCGFYHFNQKFAMLKGNEPEFIQKYLFSFKKNDHNSIYYFKILQDIQSLNTLKICT